MYNTNFKNNDVECFLKDSTLYIYFRLLDYICIISMMLVEFVGFRWCFHMSFEIFDFGRSILVINGIVEG